MNDVNDSWNQGWVTEPSVDYANFTKGQFLDDIERRLKSFMLRCVKVCRVLPKDYDARHFGHQLLRSSSSAAANFRAVRRSRSKKEYFAKLSLVIEELDESLFWIETLIDTEIISKHRLANSLKSYLNHVKQRATEIKSEGAKE